MNFTPYVILWSVLAVFTLSLAIYRRLVTRSEDTSIHFSAAEESLVSSQANLTHKLDVIDKWGETMTVVTVILGVILGGYYVYNALFVVPV